MVLVNKQYTERASTMTTPTYSEIFCCGNCHDSVAIEETMGGDLVYQCSNPACQKAVSVDCPEALAIIEDVVLKLPVKKVATNWPRDFATGKSMDWYAVKAATERGAS